MSAEIATALRTLAEENGTSLFLGELQTLERAATLLEAGDWQTIETAPTNRAILIHLPGLDYYGNNGVYAGMLVDMGTGRRWMTFGWAIGRDVGIENLPDAWMPMPSASLPNKEDRNG